jgi:hypothetical protein
MYQHICRAGGQSDNTPMRPLFLGALALVPSVLQCISTYMVLEGSHTLPQCNYFWFDQQMFSMDLPRQSQAPNTSMYASYPTCSIQPLLVVHAHIGYRHASGHPDVDLCNNPEGAFEDAQLLSASRWDYRTVECGSHQISVAWECRHQPGQRMQH